MIKRIVRNNASLKKNKKTLDFFHLYFYHKKAQFKYQGEDQVSKTAKSFANLLLSAIMKRIRYLFIY